MIIKPEHRGVLFSAIMVGSVLSTIGGQTWGTDLMPVGAPHVALRTQADRDALAQRLVPPAEAMINQ